MDILIFSFISISLLFVLIILIKSLVNAKHEIRDLDHRVRSQSVMSGLNFEQWVPLSAEYPYDPRQFRFLGNPIDGIQFEDDKVIFIEFKYGKSKLSSRQIHIKELIERGSVEFKEIRSSKNLT